MFIDMQNDRLIKARSHAIHDCLDQIISIRNFAPKDAVPCLDAIIDILKRTAASADLPRKI